MYVDKVAFGKQGVHAHRAPGRKASLLRCQTVVVHVMHVGSFRPIAVAARPLAMHTKRTVCNTTVGCKPEGVHAGPVGPNHGRESRLACRLVSGANAIISKAQRHALINNSESC